VDGDSGLSISRVTGNWVMLEASGAGATRCSADNDSDLVARMVRGGDREEARALSRCTLVKQSAMITESCATGTASQHASFVCTRTHRAAATRSGSKDFG
jgi:hypothetical protein